MAALMRAQVPVPISTAKEKVARPAVPVEPIAAIMETFHSHAIVAIGSVEFCGNEQSHAFRVSLVRGRRFADVVNDCSLVMARSRFIVSAAKPMLMRSRNLLTTRY